MLIVFVVGALILKGDTVVARLLPRALALEAGATVARIADTLEGGSLYHLLHPYNSEEYEELERECSRATPISSLLQHDLPIVRSPKSKKQEDRCELDMCCGDRGDLALGCFWFVDTR